MGSTIYYFILFLQRNNGAKLPAPNNILKKQIEVTWLLAKRRTNRPRRKRRYQITEMLAIK